MIDITRTPIQVAPDRGMATNEIKAYFALRGLTLVAVALSVGEDYAAVWRVVHYERPGPRIRKKIEAKYPGLRFENSTARESSIRTGSYSGRAVTLKPSEGSTERRQSASVVPPATDRARTSEQPSMQAAIASRSDKPRLSFTPYVAPPTLGKLIYLIEIGGQTETYVAATARPESVIGQRVRDSFVQPVQQILVSQRFEDPKVARSILDAVHGNFKSRPRPRTRVESNYFAGNRQHGFRVPATIIEVMEFLAGLDVSIEKHEARAA